MTQKLVVGKPTLPIYVPIILIVLGLSLLFLSSTPMAITGVCLMIAGFGVFPLVKKHLITSETKSRVKRTLVFINPTDKLKMMNALESNDFSILSSIRICELGTQVEIFTSADSLYASVQLYDYVPHYYEKGSKLYEFYDSEAQRVCKLKDYYCNHQIR